MSAADQHQQAPHQQQPAHPTPLQAWQQGKLTLGFSGGGFLLPYHLGVYQGLAAMGIVSSSIPMAGSSAGSLVVGGIKSGLTLQQQMDSFLEAAHACRQGGVNGRLRKVLKAQLQRTIPDDAAQHCSDGSCWISVTQVFPRPANKLYGAFSSRQQLIKAMLASCHLPRVSDGGLFTSYKSVHKRVFDGGFSNLCPVPPVPHDISTLHLQPGEAHTLSSATAPTHATPSTASSTTPAQPNPANGTNTSSSSEPHPTAPAADLLVQRMDSTKGITTRLLPVKNKPKQSNGSAASSGLSFRRVHSAPDNHTHSSVHLQHSHRTSSSSHTHHASSHSGVSLQPARPGLWGRSRQQQQQQAEQLLAASCEVEGPGAYVAAQGWFAIRVCVLPAKHMHQFPAMFRAPAADELAIALDMFQDWPHNLDATTKLALYPQDDDFLWDLFNRGRQDAEAWARQQGFPADVLQRLQEGAADAPQLKVERSSRVGSSSAGTPAADASAQQEQLATVAVADQGLRDAQQIIQG